MSNRIKGSKKKSSNEMGQKIKKLLQDLNLTQTEFGDKLGLTQKMISKWITGYRNPSLSSLKKISKATGVPLNFFLDSSGNVSNVSGSNNIIGKNQVNNLEAFEVAQKYIKKLEEEIEILKKKKQVRKKMHLV
jgi:transcriptional regulator with XRE-family HTH domain